MANIQASPVPSFSVLRIPGPGVSSRTLLYWADPARAKDHHGDPGLVRALRRVALRELQNRVPEPHPGTLREFLVRAREYFSPWDTVAQDSVPGPWQYAPKPGAWD